MANYIIDVQIWS